MSLVTRRTCPADDELAAWVEGGLGPEAHADLEEHLAACEECRSVVTDAAAALETYATPRRRRRRYIAAGTAAAAVAAMLLLVWPHGELDDAPAIRSTAGATASEDVQRIAVREPAEGAVLNDVALRFSWDALAPGTVYQLTLSDDGGAVLWRTRTESASAELPPEVGAALRPGTSYYWRVEALLPDLGSAGSASTRFEVVHQ